MTADLITLADNTLDYAERRYRELPQEQQLLVGAVVVASCVTQGIIPPPYIIQLMNHARAMPAGKGIALRTHIELIEKHLQPKEPFHVA